METIIFEVHPITLTSPRNTLTTIFKRILILLAFIFLFIFFLFEHIMHGKIRERRKYSNMLEHPNFAMPKQTNVIHDWRALVVRWLFMSFS